jgi:hypothetical protein
MGASFSQNVVDSVTKAISTMSTTIIQSTQLTEDSSQLISVTDIDGDVHITGNHFTQTATINMQALMTSLQTAEAQQSLIQELTQDAKSIISGLNMAQFADSTNTMNTLIDAEMSIIVQIGQTCTTGANQYQEIIVERVKGNVYIQNNVFDQMSNIVQNCAQNVVANNKSIQDALNKAAQSASSAAKGISEWAALLMVAIVFGLPVVGGIAGGIYALKYIFPVFIIVGAVLLALYFLKTTTDMQLTGYSTLISKTQACLYKPAEQKPQSSYETQNDAFNACMSNSDCQAFDWVAGEVQPDGSLKPYPTPQTFFYSGVSDKCQSSIKPDSVNILYTPQMFQGGGPPNGRKATNRFGQIENSNNGDVFLDTLTTDWYQLDGGVWKLKYAFTPSFNKASWGTMTPDLIQNTSVNDVYIYANVHNPSIYTLYRADAQLQWKAEKQFPGPGLIPAATALPYTNTSGFKVVEKNKLWLYGGIAFLAVGIIGTAFVYLQSKSSIPEEI